MTTEKCANCGFTEDSHKRKDFFKKQDIKMIFADKLGLQPCKQFVPQNHSQGKKDKGLGSRHLSGGTKRDKVSTTDSDGLIPVDNHPDTQTHKAGVVTPERNANSSKLTKSKSRGNK